jgi:cytosine/creatinine deaminase
LDLLIENARVLGLDRSYEISIINGKIASIGKQAARDLRSPAVIDARGNLVLPTFIEPHVHLDKVLLSEKLGEATSISEARQMVREAKSRFTVDDVRERIEHVVPTAIDSGVTVIRSHIDVDPYARTASLEAALEVQKKYSGIVDFQFVAFPQEGLIKNLEVLDFLKRALDMGATVVGGLPEAETNEGNSKKHLDTIFSLARARGLDLDVHCDVLPNFKNIEYLAAQVLENHFEDRTTVDHLIALSYYDEDYAKGIIEKIRSASINVISNPCTMMSSGNTEHPPNGRGITRVRDLVSAGVNVAFGSDNIVDPYNPLGDFNPLSNAFLLAYGAQMSSLSDIERIIRMPTYSSAKILRLRNYGLSVGCEADLNVFDVSTSRDLLRFHSKPRYVIKKGKVIAQNETIATRSY